MNEQEAVINPLKKWFKGQRAKWETKGCKHPIGETGWDLEARRKNCDLLIEAKYIKGPFVSSFSGLLSAPLTNRSMRFMKIKKTSWCYKVCWAIGTSYKTPIYHRLLDYFVRNLAFYYHYGKDVKMAYIFFVDDQGKITLISWENILKVAKDYRTRTKGNSNKKLAENLVSKYLKTKF
jgi:hypothetical protein